MLSSTRVTRLKARPATSRSTSSEDLVACERIGRQARLIKLDPKYVDTITGRRGYGIELDPHYCDVIVQRLAKVAGLEAVHAATGKSFAQVEADRTDETPEATISDGRAA